jgi:hypothetical protein
MTFDIYTHETTRQSKDTLAPLHSFLPSALTPDLASFTQITLLRFTHVVWYQYFTIPLWLYTTLFFLHLTVNSYLDSFQSFITANEGAMSLCEGLFHLEW